jgi:hypothetical protein
MRGKPSKDGGRLFGRIPAEVAAVSKLSFDGVDIVCETRRKVNRFLKSSTDMVEESRGHRGKLTPYPNLGRAGKFVPERFYPEAIRRKATGYFLYYGVPVPADFNLRSAQPLKWVPAHERWWKRHAGGYPLSVLRLLAKALKWPHGMVRQLERTFDTQQWLECQRQGTRECTALTKKDRERLLWAKYCEATWDAVRMAAGLAGATPPNWAEMRFRLLCNPEGFAREAKQMAHYCRSRVFSSQGEALPGWEWLIPLGNREKLQFSYVARALPAPVQLAEDMLDKYLRNMERPPLPLEGEDDPRPWLSRWFEEHQPKALEHRSFTIGTAACVELSGIDGGLPKMCAALILYGHLATLEFPGLRKYLFPKEVTISGLEGTIYEHWPPIRQIGDRWTKLLIGSLLCCETLAKVGRPKSLVIVAGEKGLKTRLPTAGMAPIVILQHWLRSYMDQFMERDPRISPSITPGDPMRHQVQRYGQGMVARSLDETTATDNHPFKWTFTIYQNLLEYLPPSGFRTRIGRLLPWIFGPRDIIESREFDRLDLPCDPIMLSTIHNFTLLSAQVIPMQVERTNFVPANPITGSPKGEAIKWVSEDSVRWSKSEKDPKKFFNFLGRNLDKEIIQRSRTSLRASDGEGLGLETEHVFVDKAAPYDYFSAGRPLPEWAQILGKFYLGVVLTQPIAITERGAMMGEPTSWVGLSLLNLWSYEDCVPPDRWHNIRTTGDDAHTFMFPAESKAWTTTLTRRSAEVSDTKDFEHETFGLYTELCLEGEELIPLVPISAIVGPYGASKGTTNWATAPACQTANTDRLGSTTPRKCWLMSRFYPEWVAAAKAGIPLNYDWEFGGIQLRGAPLKTGSSNWTVRQKHQYGAWWANRTVLDLNTKGSLCLLKAPNQVPSWEEMVGQSVEGMAYALVPRVRGRPLMPIEPIIKSLKSAAGGALRTLDGNLSEYRTKPDHWAAERWISLRSYGLFNELLKGTEFARNIKAPDLFKCSDAFFRKISGNHGKLSFTLSKLTSDIRGKMARVLLWNNFFDPLTGKRIANPEATVAPPPHIGNGVSTWGRIITPHRSAEHGFAPVLATL